MTTKTLKQAQSCLDNWNLIDCLLHLINHAKFANERREFQESVVEKITDVLMDQEKRIAELECQVRRAVGNKKLGGRGKKK